MSTRITEYSSISAKYPKQNIIQGVNYVTWKWKSDQLYVIIWRNFVSFCPLCYLLTYLQENTEISLNFISFVNLYGRNGAQSRGL